MDTLVLGLYSGGLLGTAGGSVLAAIDVTGRIRKYRREAGRDLLAEQARNPRPTLQLESLKNRNVDIIAAELLEERDARHRAEQRLAVAQGIARTGLWRLWTSATLVLAGVGLSGAADIVATVRAR